MGVLSTIATLLVLGVVGAIAYMVYVTIMSVVQGTEKYLEKKHITISKTGAKVLVPETNFEEYKDKVQRWGSYLMVGHAGILTVLYSIAVGAWNNSETLGFKPSFWNKPRNTEEPHSFRRSKTG